jgi:hypothetical protein
MAVCGVNADLPEFVTGFPETVHSFCTDKALSIQQSAPATSSLPLAKHGRVNQLFE